MLTNTEKTHQDEVYEGYILSKANFLYVWQLCNWDQYWIEWFDKIVRNNHTLIL